MAQISMLTRRTFLSNGLIAGLSARLARSAAFALAVPQAGETSQADITGSGSLKAHAAAHGLLVGAAVNAKLLATDQTYSRVLAEQYNILVAENAMKWVVLRPAPDKYSFEEADSIVAFAERHNMKMRGHNFVWHQQLPDWFSTTVTKKNAKQFLEDHIRTVGGHYKGKIHSWDVVNEAVLPEDGRPDGLRKSPWMELLGPDYIDIAFRAARQADPHALLTYNEYGVEYDNETDAKRR
jgi:endo-1,4-beta-xylanase